MSSKDGLSEGRMDKHHPMRSWHSGERDQKLLVSRRRLLSTLSHHPQCPHHAACAQNCTQTSQSIICFRGEQGGRTRATSSSYPWEINLLHSVRVGCLCAWCHLSKPTIHPLLRSWVPTSRNPPSEEELSPDDVLILLEGDIPADHVVEQHAQGPDGGWTAMVAMVADPLWRAVHPRSYGIQAQLVRRMLPTPASSPEHPRGCGDTHTL